MSCSVVEFPRLCWRPSDYKEWGNISWTFWWCYLQNSYSFPYNMLSHKGYKRRCAEVVLAGFENCRRYAILKIESKHGWNVEKNLRRWNVSTILVRYIWLYTNLDQLFRKIWFENRREIEIFQKADYANLFPVWDGLISLCSNIPECEFIGVNYAWQRWVVEIRKLRLEWDSNPRPWDY